MHYPSGRGPRHKTRAAFTGKITGTHYSPNEKTHYSTNERGRQMNLRKRKDKTHSAKEERQTNLRIGDIAPDFEADTTEGRLSFHHWIGESWAVLFSHPKDFTPICTTELGYLAKLKPEFDRRNVKLVGLSVDSVDSHVVWAGDIEETQGHAPNYPLIGDDDFNVSKLYGMLLADTDGDPGQRCPLDNQTVRSVFVIGPDKKIKMQLAYPMTSGRNFHELLRVIDSLQRSAAHGVATPVQWVPGQDVIIAGWVSDAKARSLYPGGWKAPKPYIRIVPDPRGREAQAS